MTTVAKEVPINHADLLALLEDGPKRAADLAVWLGATRHAVVGVLNQLVFEGLVKRTGTLKKWCLVSYRPDFTRRDLKPVVIERVQPAEPSAPMRVITIISHTEFEIVWDGRGPLPGSGEAKGLGTTLSGTHFVRLG